MFTLWQETFRDSPDYINRVLKNWVDEEFSLTLYDNAPLPRAMLCAHEFLFTGNLRGLYLHGLATRPDCRRRGLMTALIQHAVAKARTSGIDFLFLIPASQALRRWYRSLGFEDRAPRRWAMLPLAVSGGNDFSLGQAIIYESSRPAAGSIIHSAADWRCVAQEWRQAGGVTEGQIFLSDSNNYILSDFEDIQDGSRLAQDVSLRKVLLYPGQLARARERRGEVHTEPYGMIYPLRDGLNDVNFHISLLMD